MMHHLKSLVILAILTYYIFAGNFIFAQTVGPSLSLTPSVGTFNKSCEFSVNVVLNTAIEQTNGTDGVILFDSTRINVVSITKGSIYPTINTTFDNQEGKVQINGLIDTGSPYMGSGTLAIVKFKVVTTAPSGLTLVRFDFDPNDKTKTTDSNIVGTVGSSDILTNVSDASYTIGAESCDGVTPQGAVEDETLPESGYFTSTLIALMVGTVLVIIGLGGALAFGKKHEA